MTQAAVRAHYESLLAGCYTWMCGLPFAGKVVEQRALIEATGALPRKRGLAIDLGAGPGFQAIALSDLGFERVIAVDLSPALLGELNARKEGRAIETVEADLSGYMRNAGPTTADLIVCMGDTLTHLGSRDEVLRLFAACKPALAPGGSLILTWRDLSGTVGGTDRFIPVASSEDRILTCFLEYAEDTVTVHDLLYEREAGAWRFRASSYNKLRLGADWVLAGLRAAGFAAATQIAAGRLSGVAALKG
jgi:SAM-dependent methyltransferase